MMPIDPRECATTYKDVIPQTVHDTLIACAEKLDAVGVLMQWAPRPPDGAYEGGNDLVADAMRTLGYDVRGD